MNPAEPRWPSPAVQPEEKIEQREVEPLGSFLSFSEKEIEQRDPSDEDFIIMRYARYLGPEIPPKYDHKNPKKLITPAIKHGDLVVIGSKNSIIPPRKRGAIIQKERGLRQPVDPDNLQVQRLSHGGYSSEATYVGPDKGAAPSNSRMYIGWEDSRLRPGQKVTLLQYEEGYPGTATIVRLGVAEYGGGDETVELRQLQRLHPREILEILDAEQEKERKELQSKPGSRELTPDEKTATANIITELDISPEKALTAIDSCTGESGLSKEDLIRFVANDLCENLTTPKTLEKFLTLIELIVAQEYLLDHEISFIVGHFVEEAALVLEQPVLERVLQRLDTIYTRSIPDESESWVENLLQRKQDELTKSINSEIISFFTSENVRNVAGNCSIEQIDKMARIAKSRFGRSRDDMDKILRNLRYRISSIKRDAELRYKVAHALDEFDHKIYEKTKWHIEAQAKPWQDLYDEIIAR
ncbi:MAG: hypothetical protein V1898_00510 [Patescibacteria group bacterium]